MRFLFTIILIISSNTSLGNDKAIQAAINSITENEYKLANNISLVLSLAREGKINTYLINKIIKSNKSNKLFSKEINTLQILKKVQSISQIETLKRFCRKYSNNLIKFNCEKQYLIKLANSKDPEILNNIQFIKSNIKIFTKDHLDEFVYLLQRNKLSRTQKILNDSVNSYYINTATVPPMKVIENLKLNYKLSLIIQNIGLARDSTSNVLAYEVKNQIDKIFDQIDDNKDKDNIDEQVKNLLNYISLTKPHIKRFTKTSKRLLSLGKSLMRREYNRESRLIFNYLANLNLDIRNDALFESLWSYINDNKYYEANSKIVKKYNIEKTYKEHNAKLIYWSAKVSNNKKFKEIAYRYIIKSSPLSFYSILSAKELSQSKRINTHELFVKYATTTPNRKVNYKQINISKQFIKKIYLWNYNNRSWLVGEEFKSANLDLNIKYQITPKVLNLSRNYLESFKYVYRGINSGNLYIDNNVLEMLYPKPYWNKIKNSTKEFDPVIALALIRQESAFNANAKSHANARGLMQILPSTGRRYHRKLRAKSLYYPSTNIKIGTRYLSGLLDRYDNNLVYTLSAYNAGERRIERWDKKYFKSENILYNIENIPFHETRKYVKLIYRNIFFYKLINNKEQKLKVADYHVKDKIFDLYIGFNK